VEVLAHLLELFFGVALGDAAHDGGVGVAALEGEHGVDEHDGSIAEIDGEAGPTLLPLVP
jgi:hypothetical protein